MNAQSKVIKSLVDSGLIFPVFSIVLNSKVSLELRTKSLEVLLLVQQSKRGSGLGA